MSKATSSTTSPTRKKAPKAETGKATKKAASKNAATNARSASAARKTAPKASARKAAPKTADSKPKTSSKAQGTSAPQPKKQSEKKTLKTASKPAPSKATPAKASKKAANQPVEEEDKPKIAPAPMRPALRVAKRAEARRDKNQKFEVHSKIIYPAHGVGFITEIEKQSIADIDVELFVIDFEHEKMKLRVPVAKAAERGMRNLSTDKQIDDALKLLEGKARVKRTMWSRRAQEYEAKINSGDLTSVAEVVRDLFRADDQPEQSYSERQLFEQARERLAREVAAVRDGSLEDAIAEIHRHLAKKAPASAA